MIEKRAGRNTRPSLLTLQDNVVAGFQKNNSVAGRCYFYCANLPVRLAYTP